MTSFTPLGEGMYFQSGMRHNLNLRFPAARLTGSFDAIPHQPRSWLPGVSANLSYMHFGRAAMWSDAAPDEADYPDGIGGYNPHTKQCNGECGPIRHFNSSGSLHAVALTLEPYYTYNGWRFGIEAGPALYRGTWKAHMTVVSDTSPWGPKGSVETLSHSPKWDWTWVAGASVAYRNVTLRYTYIHTPPRDMTNKNIPLGYKGAHMVTLGYKF
ncbi:hypothetical protein NDR89_19475 [Cupriavidus gilardii]|uniref:Porin family protein n=1 Tax=Cupriavidus gilardii TaxID=82541 RepID=A0ABY4VP43_9BURK|nr:hypothetical protein [Cupriavidus gilardii]USE78821.1 hypothetical protein NDR89_19475 [Cupriavidus gilardii]